jgi:hypothetical protein
MYSQQASTYVDDAGVFRWVKSKEEIRVFGSNYTLPFAHGYRAIKYLQKDHKQAIDKDVYHIARMGFNGFRVHIWDAEVTDSEGNLITTQQLDLLDYTLAKMKERGIKTIVTPFKVGGNGYPERDVPAPGFSDKLEKPQTYTGDEIIAKQERYFIQLLNHVNPYTGIVYKNDPDIIALEINNEPTHDNGAIATAYINKMVQVIRGTGYKNPIFYNVSERSEFIDDYLKANIQGCTFQWYPTGLVRNSMLQENYLPHVDYYNIPFAFNKSFKNKARIIYEFDPGDTNQATLFPAMARSFREAKFQFATQFAYDAIDLAFANTEYQTHYLNLAYTPAKAISLKIAAEAFRELPHGKSFGRFPDNTTFLNTTLDAEKDVAIYATDSKFFYTGDNNKTVNNTKKLKEIAGVGNSALVKYAGTGVYFLDKISAGMWRLEVLPDVLWVNDPFAKASLNKTVAVLQNNSNIMQLLVPDLGQQFEITPINKGNNFKTATETTFFQIVPGTYVLHTNGLAAGFNKKQRLGTITLDEYATTDQQIDQIYLVHHPQRYIEKDRDLTIKTQLVAPTAIEKVEVVWPSGYQKTTNFLMKKTDLFTYQVTIPKTNLYGNAIQYHIIVYTKMGSFVFPDNKPGNPADWDFILTNTYTTNIVQPQPVINLYDASLEFGNDFLWPGQRGYSFEKNIYKDVSQNALHITVNDFPKEYNDFTFKILVNKLLKTESHHIGSLNKLMLEAASSTSNNQKVQVALQQKDGLVFGKVIELTPKKQRFSIPFSEFSRVPMVLLPRAYPGFQPYLFQSKNVALFDLNNVEAVQFSIMPETKNPLNPTPASIFLYKIALH